MWNPRANPNSAHQWWSKWTIQVTPPRPEIRTIRTEAEFRTNVSRFLRKAFGSASVCRMTAQRGAWRIEVRTEGHPVHDPAYRAYLTQAFTDFFTVGFGVGTRVEVEAKLEAGSAQDGTPAEQLLVLPPLRLEEPVGGH